MTPKPEPASTSCGYQGFEFGGGYLDSVCIDGYLWDADSCDEPGSPILSCGGDIPCPKCDPEGYAEYYSCPPEEVSRRIARAFGETPWIPSNGPQGASQ